MRRNVSYPFLLSILAAIAVAAPTAASASPHGGLTTTVEGPTGHVGPSTPNHAQPKKRKARKSSAGKRAPVLLKFLVTPRTMLKVGRNAVVRFRIKDRDARVQVSLSLFQGKGPERKLVTRKSLGKRRTGVTQSYKLKGAEFDPGYYRVVIRAHDRAGHSLRRAKSSSVVEVQVVSQRFPVAGAWVWGGDGSKFGAPRRGHTHQGYDLTAPEGTPVVAPISGAIKFRQYQKGGAGHYLILDGDDGFDYAFMHLQTGSQLVNEGDRVSMGQQIAAVGTTGGSTGPHLHFEIWKGGWWEEGGKPIDPEQILREWAAAAGQPHGGS